MSRPVVRASFAVQVLVGMVAGVALGLIARQLGPEAGGPLAAALERIGSIFVQLLKVLVPPLVFTAVVAAVAALGRLQDAAVYVWRTVLWFGITALAAVLVGLALGLWLQPGIGSGVSPSAAAPPRAVGSWLDFLTGLVPGNVFGLTASTKVVEGQATTTLGFNALQIVVVALTVGIAATRLGEAGRPFLAFNESALLIVRRVLVWVVRLTPIGSAALLGHAVVRYGWESLAPLGTFAGTVYLGLAVVLFGVYPIALLLNGLDPRRFFAGVWPAIQLAFVTRSSIATLPVTESAVETRLGVPAAYAAFAIPLGATTKMDGCAAVFPAVAALFVAQFYGLTLGPADYLLIVLVSVFGSTATAGVTGATVMLTLTLSTLGLPLEGAGLLLAIDPVIDMGRTAVNVAVQALVPTVVAKRRGVLDEAVYGGGRVSAAKKTRDRRSPSSPGLSSASERLETP